MEKNYNRIMMYFFLVTTIICLLILDKSVRTTGKLNYQLGNLEEEVEALEHENSILKEDILFFNTSVNHWKEEYEKALEEYEKAAEKIEELEARDYVGEFKVTWYTAGVESTGKTPEHPEYGITASGTTVTSGRTIASDWSVLPPGTRVYIEGIGERVVEDSGSGVKGNHVDVYIPSLDEAYKRGVSYAKVYILEEEG